jgi:hypothetical protein
MKIMTDRMKFQNPKSILWPQAELFINISGYIKEVKIIIPKKVTALIQGTNHPPSFSSSDSPH